MKHSASLLFSFILFVGDFIALIAALALAQVGIIDLVAKGYEIMAYAMIVVYAVPLLFASRKLFTNR